MTDDTQHFFRNLESLGQPIQDPVPVTLSPELIGLLSDQLYRSPSKAIEELVVNAYDADATEARVAIEEVAAGRQKIAVFDDGFGMTYDGIADLWKVGRPKSRWTLGKHAERKQIGKFGIGKLSTYAIASRVTYITKSYDGILAVNIDYQSFTSRPDTTTTRVRLPVRQIPSVEDLFQDSVFPSVSEHLDLSSSVLAQQDSWTLVLLEELKDKARSMKLGRLRWVLSTAMPLGSDFRLTLNGDRIESSKETYETVVNFEVADLPASRIRALHKKTGDQWYMDGQRLTSESFPSGISGHILVTRRSLMGKSDDLGRSEGFFVHVRDRLVNQEDARFGLHELSHATLNRFRAQIHIDDLDKAITANRESMEDVDTYRKAQMVLNEIFNEARQRYEEYEDSQRKKTPGEREEDQNWVPERLVELPTADALIGYSRDHEGADADESWMYLNVARDADADQLARKLYSQARRESPYTYGYAARGRSERLVEFDVENMMFTLNQDHELTIAYANDPMSQRLLHDFATAETLLEVYLREAGVAPHVVGEILERRDLLFRGLADAQMFSLDSLSDYIRRSADSVHDLEIGVVAGVRALGFVAKHLVGADEPGGIARFIDYPEGEQSISLEAHLPGDSTLNDALDFDSISQHVSTVSATGCLLVVPGYSHEDSERVSQLANANRVSCWTVQQLAKVVASAEARHIGARQILDVVLSRFEPKDVEAAVEELLESSVGETRELYVAILQALQDMEGRVVDARRDIKMIANELSRMDEFDAVTVAQVHRAVSEMVTASRRGLLLRDNQDVVLNVSHEELARRVEAVTHRPGSPRRRGNFGTNRSDEALPSDKEFVPAMDVTRIIQDGESQTVEFKSTSRWNMLAGKQDKRIEHAIVKAACAFLNAEGGHLLIGVDDDGKVVGLTRDMETLGRRPNRDGYELFLRQLLDNHLSVPTAGMINIGFETLDDLDVCVVSVSRSTRPVFAKPAEGVTDPIDFWVRTGNATKQLHGDDMLQYQASHWRA